MTRRTLRRISSRFRRGMGPTRRALLARYTRSPEPRLRSRCVVQGSSFSSVAEHGGETGRAHHGYAVRDDARTEHVKLYRLALWLADTDEERLRQLLRDAEAGEGTFMPAMARMELAKIPPAALWGDWTWHE